MDESWAARLAAGRCVAAMIFGVFGGCWLLAACLYGRRLQAPVVVGIVLVATGLVGVAARLRRRAQPRAAGYVETAADVRVERQFWWINGVTWVAVALLFAVLPQFGLSNYVFPAFVAVVGAHFFPMTGRYRRRANLLTGGAMVVWAVVCVAVWRGNGVRMAVWVTAGAGVVLWVSAAGALRTAGRLLRGEFEV